MSDAVPTLQPLPLPLPITPRRAHLSRLMKVWRSGGWPSRDEIELELLAAGWVRQVLEPSGHETLRLTDAGIHLLVAARQQNQRPLSAHDRLAERVARQLREAGRIVWRELSLRAQVASGAQPATPVSALLAEEPPLAAKAPWRMARPDIFSVRNTSVAAYLQPVVHEIKVSRADLLSDLRHLAKRESYQWLCSECHYVFPEGIAEPDEIPEGLGVWVLRGEIDDGQLELLRPARHQPCELPFAVWLALAKSSPLHLESERVQGHLGEPVEPLTLPDPSAAPPAC